MLARYQAKPPQEALTVPNTLNLLALERVITLNLQPTVGACELWASLKNNDLHLKGATEQISLVGQGVAGVLKDVAREAFTERLSELSTSTQLSFNKITIRGQKTRWGSCSSQGNISLNYKLLFLPANMVRYVLLHELAHTRHLNHSARYWQFLSSLEPQAKTIDQSLRTASKYVPRWLDGGMG
jgi:predicted metal-dependent hydrolase